MTYGRPSRLPKGEIRRDRGAQIRELAERHHQASVAERITTCNQERRLNDILSALEAMSAENGTVGRKYLVYLIDKSAQNAINYVGGTSAGDQSIQAYLDCVAATLGLVRRVIGDPTIDYHTFRVSGKSDELVGKCTGDRLPDDVEGIFSIVWQVVKKRMDLRRYSYEVDGKELNLEAFARVLRHPETVVACTHSFSPVGEVPLSGNFLRDRIAEIEAAEIVFRDHMPAGLKMTIGSPEIQTGFTTNLTELGYTSMNKGCYVEIRLHAVDSRELLAFI
ncbi:hypothetical protein HZC07_03340, partial [Candidatus Micrarchaeota archaeon]|nr:hypothetical protein [Candidatus Micrarchaeota archaeon]